MKRVLLVGSNSDSRHRLLREAQIPFAVIGHLADEAACEIPGLSFQALVESVALAKMEHVNLGALTEHENTCFILTADTLCQTKDGNIQGKPVDRADAMRMIKDARAGATVGTAFCVDKREFVNSEWRVIKRLQKFVTTDYIFNMPDAWMEQYFQATPGLQASGAISIEAFGDQFLQVVHGSYSAIVGLPMFEVRQALEEIGFYAWVGGL